MVSKIIIGIALVLKCVSQGRVMWVYVFFGFFTDSSRFLYMCIIYKMPSFGILLVTFIVWMSAVMIAVSLSNPRFSGDGGASFCKATNNTSFECKNIISRHRNFNIARYSSIIYVFLLPILTIIGFTAETSIPLIAFILIWIIINIVINLKRIDKFFN